MAETRRELRRLEAESESSGAVLARLGDEVDQRTLRAPVAGVIAELSDSRIGSQVAVGDRLATLVPDGEMLVVVAQFDPSRAAGRLRPGQAAELRLEAFPWTEYGVIGLEVSRVAQEPRDGRLWAQLTLRNPAGVDLELVHGMPGTVLVRAEETTPLSLLLRSVGHRRVAGTQAAR